MEAAVELEAESESDRWRTPEWLVLRARGFATSLLAEWHHEQSDDDAMLARIFVDPCTEADNPTRAYRFFARADDGLSRSWDMEDLSLAWVNPPYSRGQVTRWLDKVEAEVGASGGHALVLLKADATTAWHRQARLLSSALCRLDKRLHFTRPDGTKLTGANFASELFYAGDRPHAFADAFGAHGYVEVIR